MSALRASCRRMSRWARSASIRSRSSTPSLRSRAASGWSCPMRSGTIAAASASRASPPQSSMRSATLPSGTDGRRRHTRAAGRLARRAALPPTRGARSGRPGRRRRTSPQRHRGPLAGANQPSSSSLVTSMATCPMSRCPRASRSPPTTALPTSRWQGSDKDASTAHARHSRRMQGGIHCLAASEGGRRP